MSLLHALHDLQLSKNPESIYGIPLVTVYARMERIMNDDDDDDKPLTTTAGGKNKKKTTNRGGGGRGRKNNNAKNDDDSSIRWKVQLGIYMHRLLPEILTCQTLHGVISALDPDSYQITQPLVLPPSGKAVFASSTYPKIDMSLIKYNNEYDSDDSDDGDDDDDSDDADTSYENNKDKKSKQKRDSSDMDDRRTSTNPGGTLEGGEREERIISPFSTRGLLKLLECRGCDVSNVSVVRFWKIFGWH